MDEQITIGKSRLETYIDSVSEGFQKNTQETIVILITIVLIIVGTVLIYRWYLRKKSAREKAEYANRYNSLSQKKKLTPSDNALLLDLFRFAPKHTPGLISLVTDPRFFSAAVKQYLQSYPGRERRVASLRFRLGFQVPGNGSILVSSTGLEDGTSLLIKTKQNENIIARVTEVNARGFSVRAEKELPQKGLVTVSLYMKSGIYTFQSEILSVKDEEMVLSHSELIERTQKRTSLRKAMKSPVLVEVPVPDADGDIMKLRGRILDLSADGARLSLPKCGLEKGSSITLMLFRNTDSEEIVEAEVVRIEEGEGTAGVRFTNIGKKARERIIETVFH